MMVLLVFYTVEPKNPELYYLNNNKDLQKYNERIVELTKHKAKFCVYKVEDCVGDFS